MNNETQFAVAAVLASNFVISDGQLKSCDVRAHSRRNVLEEASYGPSPLYTWRFSEMSTTRLQGAMITKLDGNEMSVGSILLERP